MNLICKRACLAAAAATAVIVSGCGGSASGPSATPAPSPSASASPQQQASTPVSATLPSGYLPLYPFASPADAQAWEASYRSGGHQPWHLSAGMTATAFTAYLGYADVNRVVHQTVSNGDAHVSVGVALPGGRVGTAAVVHLVRFGSGQYAPWEVVGTDDTTFSLDTPAYGSTVASPVGVGGKITGVDENIRLQVYRLPAGAPVGTYCCRPAGGAKTPWSATVTFHAAAGQVLTIAASTGGHVAAVERFAVTGVRAG